MANVGIFGMVVLYFMMGCGLNYCECYQWSWLYLHNLLEEGLFLGVC